MGLDGLEDAPRSARRPIYHQGQRSQVPATARSVPPRPTSGEVPASCHWTLDLLQRELNQAGVSIKRSQIRRTLKEEHLA